MGRTKVNITKEELEKLYHIDNLSEQAIADKLDININTVKRWREKLGVAPKTKEEIYALRLKSNIESGKWNSTNLSAETLYDLYITQNKSQKEIADLYNLTLDQMKYLIKKYNYVKDESDKQKSREEYCIQKTGKKIYCLQDGIVRKPYEHKDIHDIDLESLKADYLSCNYNISELAKKYNVGTSTIKNRIKRLNVKRPKQDEIALQQKHKFGESKYEFLHSREAFETKLKKCRRKEATFIADKFGIALTTLYRYLDLYGLRDYLETTRSAGEFEVKQFLSDLGIETNKDRTILDPLEIDLYSPEYKIGIEFNGDYWHSSLKKTKNYHYKKSCDCETKGIRLIHIYEYEWKDPSTREIIKSMLRSAFGKNNTKIYARNCEVREVSNREVREFINSNHIQGNRDAKVTYGLFHDNELIQIMSFTYMNKHEWWEIIRECTKSGCTVVGGVSKLFKHFIKIHNPDKIFSYCDFNKFNGHGYESLGMKFIGYTGPDMKWIMEDGSVANRNPSHNKYMKEHSIAQIWGAGSKKYLWTKPE